MESARWVAPYVLGRSRFDSAPFSNRWNLTHDGERVATLRRRPSDHTSSAELADGTVLDLRPEAWGTIVLNAFGEPFSRIERQSWWGRRWEISGLGFSCALTSDPRPRRWSLRFGNEPIGRLTGGFWSYNRLDVDTDVSVPVHALVLAWHVLARPWEQAAAPRSLVPDREST